MTDETESHEPIERPANRTGRGVAIFVVVLVAYVLSPVPMGWLLNKFNGLDFVDRAFEVFYAPLLYVAERIEFVAKFYEWQVRFVGL